ncbi:hypothetical protein [uncultured Sphingomonas sp.]|uniref:hypothetical protein n=1 Tax=uncultured Sphingomonas sp. TaxID=158754 RepID=UPI0025D96E15|nr:hypothetical protein [uncultured Sphingomonas sp.]
MAKKKRYLTATMADGYVKTIGPTAAPFTHFWRIVAVLDNGKTEVFWGHSKSAKEALGKKTALAEAAKKRAWASFAFEVVELRESPAAAGGGSGGDPIA